MVPFSITPITLSPFVLLLRTYWYWGESLEALAVDEVLVPANNYIYNKTSFIKRKQLCGLKLCMVNQSLHKTVFVILQAEASFFLYHQPQLSWKIF